MEYYGILHDMTMGLVACLEIERHTNIHGHGISTAWKALGPSNACPTEAQVMNWKTQ